MTTMMTVKLLSNVTQLNIYLVQILTQHWSTFSSYTVHAFTKSKFDFMPNYYFIEYANDVNAYVNYQ